MAEKVIWRPSWTFYKKKTLDAGKRYKINKRIFLLDKNINIIVHHERTKFFFALWLFLHATFNVRRTLATLLVGLCYVFHGTRCHFYILSHKSPFVVNNYVYIGILYWYLVYLVSFTCVLGFFLKKVHEGLHITFSAN